MAASSENLPANIDPFLLRHSFSDYFWPTPFDNDSLSKSIVYHDHDLHSLLLQQPDQHHQQQQFQHQSLSPFSSSDLEQNQHKLSTTTTHPLTPSSDPETSTTLKRNMALNGKSRITKRKSRATKKNQTTFITTDPSNFRQMVQQVTGIRFDSTTTSSTLPQSLSRFLKPEIHRPVGRLYNAGLLPTLDTSSFLLNQSQSMIGDRSAYGAGVLNSVGVGAQSGNGCEGDGYGASDGFACFPTLESWKVM